MKPIILEMQAFGPYRERMQIDFRDLGQTQLFLITGPTGAGKTTIFDAIVYALYGKTSGSSRQEAELKSDLASDHELSYVYLSFELGGKTYSVKRIPQQKGPSPKTQRPINLKANVTFDRGDRVFQKTQEANQALEELLGLSVDQFRQIVMLPQGEFKQLLEAPSREKEVIFRKIFTTYQLKNFQDDLLAKKQTLEKEMGQDYQTLKEDQAAILDLLDEASQEALREAANQEDFASFGDQVAEALEDQRASVKAAEKKIGDGQAESQALNQHLERLKEADRLAQVQADLDQKSSVYHKAKADWDFYQKTRPLAKNQADLEQLAEVISQERKRLGEVEAEASRYQAAKEAAQSSLEASQDSYAQVDDWEEELAQMRLEEHDLKSWLKKRENIQALDQSIQASQKKLLALQENQARLEQKIDLAKEKAQQIQAHWLNPDDLLKERYQLENKQAAYATYRHLMASKQEQADQFSQLELAYQAAQETWRQTQSALEAGRLREQADYLGKLAADLVPGQACPLCGSLDHPVPYEGTSDQEGPVPDIASLETEERQAYQDLTQLGSQLGYAQKEFQQLINQLEDQAKEGGFSSDLSEEDRRLKDQADQLLAKEKAQAQRQRDYDQVQEDLVTYQAKQVAVKQEEGQLRERLDNQESQYKDLKEDMQALAAQLNYQEMDALLAAEKELEQKIQKVKEAYQKAQASFQAASDQVVRLKAQKDGLEESLGRQDQRYQEGWSHFQASLADFDLTAEDLSTYHRADKDWSAVEKFWRNYEQDRYALDQQIAKNRQALATREETLDLDQTQARLKEVSDQVQKEQKFRDSRLTQLARLDQLDQAFSARLARYQAQSQHYGELVLLAEVANGTRSGSQRISFERYILAYYFDQIIQQANRRFKQMTSGRYQFLRDHTDKGGIAAKGLDLAVMDYYSGSSRSVQSLSGGESFKASLSLALALSDVIQNHAGGIEISTLFIDEGFGSLDEESLHQAMDTLIELQEASGRLIAIISHVEELKQELPVQLAVTASPAGSRCAFRGLTG
ncbi:SMC family ATPase [Aerococcus sp. UMB10185]|uniref:SMC family ATPase n=1 Tax=Aerococcus sp. UMB10185 TaxID=3046357 RepID=UPI00254ACB82|nr:SMC family ATPase [Aerococcus sp. UMB10185]MDK6233293.1 SMC family ATPase [Aerococcus sp. UMB10185]